jgi:predicted secreted protein
MADYQLGVAYNASFAYFFRLELIRSKSYKKGGERGLKSFQIYFSKGGRYCWIYKHSKVGTSTGLIKYKIAKNKYNEKARKATIGIIANVNVSA